MYNTRRKALCASILAILLEIQVGVAADISEQDVKEVHTVNVTANRTEQQWIVVLISAVLKEVL